MVEHRRAVPPRRELDQRETGGGKREQERDRAHHRDPAQRRRDRHGTKGCGEAEPPGRLDGQREIPRDAGAEKTGSQWTRRSPSALNAAASAAIGRARRRGAATNSLARDRHGLSPDRGRHLKCANRVLQVEFVWHRWNEHRGGSSFALSDGWAGPSGGGRNDTGGTVSRIDAARRHGPAPEPMTASLRGDPACRLRCRLHDRRRHRCDAGYPDSGSHDVGDGGNRPPHRHRGRRAGHRRR